MTANLPQLIDAYDPNAPLDRAFTIPSSWYTDKDLYNLELKTVFSNSWQYAARRDQLETPGQFVTTDIAGEPLVVVRGNDGMLRAFFNVCRHHAAAVMTEPSGKAAQLRCPYHGWTYSLEGNLKAAPDMGAVSDLDRNSMGLAPMDVMTWKIWAWVNLGVGTQTPGELLPG